jgi:hypothetical protein
VVAEAKSYLSRTPSGVPAYDDHIFAGLKIPGSEARVSVYHTHSFNDNYSGTQTSVRFSMPVLKRSYGIITAGAGIGYLTRRTYILPHSVASIPVNASEPSAAFHESITEANAFGLEAGLSFYSRKIFASIAAINFNRPVLIPSKFEYREPVSLQASVAYCVSLGNGNTLIPYVTVRNQSSLNFDAVVLTNLRKVTMGGGLQNINPGENSISPMVYAEAAVNKNLRFNASFSHLTPLSGEQFSDNISEPRNVVSLGVKYSK